MRSFFGIILAGVCAVGAHAEEVTWRFVWEGGQGHEMHGALRYDDGHLEGPLVRETDVTCFHIIGQKDGVAFGAWSLGQLENDTSWRLHFMPGSGAFVVEGLGIWMPQAWNMDGNGMNCGAGGFGFNIGNAAQDLCHDGQLLVASQVSPPTPFPAIRDDAYAFPKGACLAPLLLGALR